MLISLNWLREWLPDLDPNPEVTAALLTGAGLEVEAIHTFGADLQAALVARVVQVEPHPGRERLKLVQVVTAASGAETVAVVCGAPNVPAPGGLVALAPLGAKLTAPGLVIERRSIDGIESHGMLCSEAELGVAESSTGLLLPAAGAPGQALSELYPGAVDTILELGITPNRPDALGHLGVARELGALLDCALAPFSIAAVPTLATSAQGVVTLDNRSPQSCPLYLAGIVRGIKVGPSPEWLRWRLHSLGVRPINNAVDVTNWMLLLYGQPMHAFDLSRLRGQRIVIRRAEPAERFTTLDGIERQLHADDLVIADGERVTALAGIMGGQDSEISDTTEDVLLECAYFEPASVRRSARRHQLHTDSSFRFERGIDYGAVPRVLEHAQASLIALAGGKASSGVVSTQGQLPATAAIRLRSARVTELLGVAIDFDTALAGLQRLGFHSQRVEPGVALVAGASWRPDVSQEADLIEEIARLHGFENIPAHLPSMTPQKPRSSGQLESELGSLCAALGLSETVMPSFVAPSDLALLGAPPAVVTLQNPLTEERAVMRTSLLPGLLEVLERALRRGESDLRIFALGNLFLPPRAGPASREAQRARPRDPSEDGVLPEERPALAILLHGDRPAHLAKPEPLDVYDLKGTLHELIDRSWRHPITLQRAVGSPLTRHLHPRAAAHVIVAGQVIGSAGPLHPDIADALHLERAPLLAELDLSALEAIPRRALRYVALPRVPAITRDVALEVAETTACAEVEQLLREHAGELCESVHLFDTFRGGGMAAGHWSLAFRLTYRDPKARSTPDSARTLTDKEVDEHHERAILATSKALNASVRV